jgi:hypothetical protein
MHGLVLRHAFRPTELERLLGPWTELLGAAGRTANASPRRSPRGGDWSPRRGT